jgi:hypothetical protein
MDQFPHRVEIQEGVVAVGLGPRDGGASFVAAFAHAWPIEEAAQFTALLQEIDDAECEIIGSGPGKFR